MTLKKTEVQIVKWSDGTEEWWENGVSVKAISAFAATKAEIDEMLTRLAAFSADHFGVSPDSADWGDVGTLQHYRDKLREIADSAFREGEYKRQL